jgi:hypothetical protein
MKYERDLEIKEGRGSGLNSAAGEGKESRRSNFLKRPFFLFSFPSASRYDNIRHTFHDVGSLLPSLEYVFRYRLHQCHLSIPSHHSYGTLLALTTWPSTHHH